MVNLLKKKHPSLMKLTEMPKLVKRTNYTQYYGMGIRPIKKVWFQQNGTAGHFGIYERQYPESWIGRQGAIEMIYRIT